MKQSLKRKRLAHKFLHNLELIKLGDFLFSGSESQVHSETKMANNGKKSYLGEKSSHDNDWGLVELVLIRQWQWKYVFLKKTSSFGLGLNYHIWEFGIKSLFCANIGERFSPAIDFL